jgi:hypothetical protein
MLQKRISAETETLLVNNNIYYNRMKKLIFSFLTFTVLTNYCTAQVVKVSFADTTFKQSFTGNVLLYLSKDNKEPKSGTAGLDIFPCFRVYVKNIKPGEAIVFDDHAISFPVKLSDIERGEYYVQAVLDRNLGGRSIANSPGNLYSEAQKINVGKDYGQVFTINANKTIRQSIFKETKYAKEFKAPSILLSKFYKRKTTLDAAVVLPKEYLTEPNRKFPILFNISGFGGDYHYLSGMDRASQPIDTTACIKVYLDGNCPLGHSEYANSDNNGPWGDALTTEMIPLLEKQYRCNGAKLLTGHSSGGWSVLWLQVHYPKVFNGCWSSSPDPVDFRSFQKIDLYTHQNIFYAKDSTLNQTGTIAGFFPWFNMRSIYRMENVIYRGEQMHSFDAVFSKRGKDGIPERITDVQSGEVDSTVFSNWKNYDVSYYLRNNWGKLKPDLDNKIRVTVGKQDNFLLNYAVVLLETEMKKLNANVEFAYYPGDHFTLSTPQFNKDGNEFLEKKYEEWKVKQRIN